MSATTGFVDLHTHTTCSDGLLSPRELVSHASNCGLEAISVTDHDSVHGVTDAQAAGIGLGVDVLAGVELSASGAYAEIHVLGYLFDPESPELECMLQRYRRRRFERAEKIVERLNELGVPLQMSQVVELAGATAIGRPHLAQALTNNGFANSFDDAFRKYLRRGSEAFVAKERLSPQEAIRVIHDAGGVAVVAHPTYGPNEQELRAMVEAGLDGIEVRHPLLSANDTARFTKIAKQYTLVPTGGSDYHGVGRSKCELGGMRVTREAVHALRERQAQLAAGR